PRRVLHCSTTGVYAHAGQQVLDESAPLGDNHLAIMPTYSISKIAAEAVVRTAARQHGIPTTIARLNVPYGVGPDGTPRGWPAFHLAMMEAGLPIPVHPDRPNVFNPIELTDIALTVPALLDAASVPATTVNWAGTEAVSLEEWCTHLGRACGLAVHFEETLDTIGGVSVSTELLRSITGSATSSWRQGFDRLAAAHLALRDAAGVSASNAADGGQ
ncbi:MAG: NAD-dependent epimerase/dehydratase family protein, partial [Actinomycetes bacterium]